MEAFSEKLNTLLKKPEEYLRPNSELRTSWSQQTKAVYDFLKEEEKRCSLPSCKEALPELCVDGFDDEQIWQLLELQNKNLLAAPDNLEELDDINLCYMVAKLSSLAKYDKLTDDWDEGMNGSFDGGGSDENSELDNSEDDAGDDENDLEQEDEDEDEEAFDEPSDDDDDNDDDLLVKPDDIDKELDTHFDSDSDNEVDNFDDFVAAEGEETDSSEDEDNPQPEERVAKKKEKEPETKKPVKPPNPPNFEKSRVDSKFFNLRESEWIADNDILGQNFDEEEDEDIDYMAEMSEDEEEEGPKYNEFFDGDSDEKRPPKKLSKMLNGNENVDEDEDENQNDDENEEEEPMDEDENGENNDLEENEESSGVTPLLGRNQGKGKSTFEKEKEREIQVMSKLEEDLTAAKPWHLKGEASVKDRPENSALEETMEYNISSRQKPIITEDVTNLLERIIIGRIRSKAWDDVERKVKPTTDPFEFKKKLLLDQEKSKQSLAEIYEKEYLKQNEKPKEAEEELPEHKDIKERMEKLFANLDGLANFHYLPKHLQAEVKIQSNLPAINLEDATPITMSNAATLAPQEVLAPVKGDLKGDTERTSTDKKRKRRVKKIIQRQKAKATDKKIQEKLRKSGPEGKLGAKLTAKFIQKAVKTGQVKMLEEKETKALKSSKSFFTELQDINKGNKKDINKKKKNDHGFTATRILL